MVSTPGAVCFHCVVDGLVLDSVSCVPAAVCTFIRTALSRFYMCVAAGCAKLAEVAGR